MDDLVEVIYRRLLRIADAIRREDERRARADADALMSRIMAAQGRGGNDGIEIDPKRKPVWEASKHKARPRSIF
jgi:hypothetical protein